MQKFKVDIDTTPDQVALIPLYDIAEWTGIPLHEIIDYAVHYSYQYTLY